MTNIFYSSFHIDKLLITTYETYNQTNFIILIPYKCLQSIQVSKISIYTIM